jgi:hypothetical protein
MRIFEKHANSFMEFVFRLVCVLVCVNKSFDTMSTERGRGGRTQRTCRPRCADLLKEERHQQGAEEEDAPAAISVQGFEIGVSSDRGSGSAEHPSGPGGNRNDKVNVGLPPAYDGSREAGAWEEYHARAKLWLHTTNLDGKQQGPHMLQMLSGNAFDMMRIFADDEEWYEDPNGGWCLLDILGLTSGFISLVNKIDGIEVSSVRGSGSAEYPSSSGGNWNNFKNGLPPAWDGSRKTDAWEEYLARAKLWLHTTNLDGKQQGPHMLQMLSGNAFDMMRIFAEDDEWYEDPKGGWRILEKMTGIMSSGTKITGLGELEDNLHDDNEGTSSKRKSDGSDRGEDADAADDSKKKYRRVALKCHPDKMLSATESEKTAAETRFKAVNEANEVLSSEEKRKEYDFG